MAYKATVNVTLTDAYQNLASLVDGANGKIPIGTGTANSVTISIYTEDASLAWGDTIPMVEGHPVAVGDSWTFSGLDIIAGAWLKNKTAGSNSDLVITAFQDI